MSISGILSSVHIYLDLSQYSLIMGMLGENLGEQLESFDAPSTVLIDPLVMVWLFSTFLCFWHNIVNLDREALEYWNFWQFNKSLVLVADFRKKIWELKVITCPQAKLITILGKSILRSIAGKKYRQYTVIRTSSC